MTDRDADKERFAMEQQFYLLDTIWACDSKLYAGGQWVNDTREHCSRCNVFTEQTEPPEIEIELNHLGRQGFVEYLWNSHSLPIFRRDLVDLWERNCLTGFHTKPVRITGWYDKPYSAPPENTPDYLRLVTTNKVALCVPPPVAVCPECDFVQYGFPKAGPPENGISIDQAAWNGADFFGVRQYDFAFCTRLAAETTLRAGYNRHIAFVRTQDWYRWGGYDVRKWTPKAYREHVESFLIRHVEDL